MLVSKSQMTACGESRSHNHGIKRYSCTLGSALLVMFLPLLLGATALGQLKTLYSFTGGADGRAPSAGLVRDAAGSLYGTTTGGGNQQAVQCQAQFNGCGVVFKLTNAGGTWTETVIHTFVPGTDGINPLGNLIFDSAGNLYGTTEYGGTGCAGLYGCGTVYELSPDGSGGWTEKILYNVKSGSDGNYPEAGLILDSAGNLYGTTGFGANSSCNGLGCGTVFELTPNGDGTWTEHILYVFQDGSDGGEPGSALTFDTAGNLYGTAAIGGNMTCNAPFGCGVIYKLSPSAGGWLESSLHNFDCTAGCFPNSGLAIDDSGALYGNMVGGGAHVDGYVYRLSPGTFVLTPIYSFDSTHGAGPEGTPLFAGGVLYGTVSSGGIHGATCSNGCGGVFSLAPGTTGVRYHFAGFGGFAKGANPLGNVILDPAGNLYGTTSSGGAFGAGTVFEAIR